VISRAPLSLEATAAGSCRTQAAPGSPASKRPLPCAATRQCRAYSYGKWKIYHSCCPARAPRALVASGRFHAWFCRPRVLRLPRGSHGGGRPHQGSINTEVSNLAGHVRDCALWYYACLFLRPCGPAEAESLQAARASCCADSLVVWSLGLATRCGDRPRACEDNPIQPTSIWERVQ
jgi:hypothetical protein